METVRAAVVGASGYTGAELMRILASHPRMGVTYATANRYAGEPIQSLYPSLAGYYPGLFQRYDPVRMAESCDVVFMGLPHTESMKIAPGIVEAGKKVVDLSADFRFSEPGLYARTYGVEHQAGGLLEGAVYGLPEFNRAAVPDAEIVANPGCYPTGALLGLIPLARAGMIGGPVAIDAKSGVSGAGRKTTLATHYPQVADGICPYAVSGHRHQPEIASQLEKALGGRVPELVFVPHLTPMNRGILCTMYVVLKDGAGSREAREVLNDAYDSEEFVIVLPEGSYPETKSVQGTNSCHVAVEETGGGKMLVVMTAIDNLVKGASGQAVQNMNLLCGLPEGEGLAGPGLFP